MIHDWDLWPIYLDQGWVDAESAARWADMNRRIAEVVKAWNDSLLSAAEMAERLTLVKHHPAPTARK